MKSAKNERYWQVQLILFIYIWECAVNACAHAFSAPSTQRIWNSNRKMKRKKNAFMWNCLRIAEKTEYERFERIPDQALNWFNRNHNRKTRNHVPKFKTNHRSFSDQKHFFPCNFFYWTKCWDFNDLCGSIENLY